MNSADQLSWGYKNSNPEIPATIMSTTAATALFGTDGGAIPTLGYARLEITVTSVNVHLKIWATLRDCCG